MPRNRTGAAQDLVRFYSKIVCRLDSGCWEWQRMTNPQGYGMFSVRGELRWHPMLAHRFSWQALVGPIPEGLFVCHHCDNPICVRPDHLFVGTHTDNMADMYRKGRGCIGDAHHTRQHPENLHRNLNHHMTKISDDDVRLLRELHTQGVRPSVLAARFGISCPRVSDLLHGRGRSI
jgi:hypothetical protein